MPISGATAVTTTGTVSGEFTTYFTNYLLKHAVQLTVLDQFADKQPFPKNVGSKAIRWFKQNVADASQVQTLVEGTTPNQTTFRQITLTTVEATLTQYGQVASVTDVLTWTDRLKILKATIGLMTEDCALKADSVIRNEIAATNLADNGSITTNTYGTDRAPIALVTHTYAGLSAPAYTDATTRITGVDVLGALTTLKTNRAPTINGEYVGIMAPAITYDLMQDSKWLTLAQYSTPERLIKGEVGKFYGVRVVEATNPFCEGVTTEGTYSVAAGVNTIYQSIFTGKDAYGCPIMAGQSPFSPHVYMVDGADKYDPLNQQTMAGWKGYWCAKLLQSNWLVVFHSKSGSGIVPASSP